MRNFVSSFSVWISVGVLFGALLLWAQRTRSALDDTDPAYQRPGTLIPAGEVRAPRVLSGYPRAGRHLAVIFARSMRGQVLFHDLAFQSDVAALADLVLVTPDGTAPTIANGLRATVADSNRTILNAYGLRTPRDGGYPIGYVLVDRDGFIRHRTLDPHCIGMGHTQEMRALLRALQ